MKKPAQALNDEGEKLLFTRRSSMSLLNLLPVERRQSEADLKKAAALFEKALAVDPAFSIAAYHLGQVNQLLLEARRVRQILSQAPSRSIRRTSTRASSARRC